MTERAPAAQLATVRLRKWRSWHLTDLRTFSGVPDKSGIAVYATLPSVQLERAPILFVHGMWGGSWVWQRFFPHFLDLGYPCHAVDLRNHGASFKVEDVGRVSLDDYIQDISQAAQTLDKPILIGHSMGGLLVLKLCEVLNLSAVVIICPSQPRGNFGPPARSQLWFIARHLGSLVFGRPISPSLSEAKKTALNRLHEDDVEWVFRHSSEGSGSAFREVILGKLSVDPDQITCPVLAIGAADDKTMPARVVKRVADGYGAEYREIAEAGHMLPLEPKSAEAAKEVTAWLESTIPAA